MDLKKEYYKLSSEEFKNLLDRTMNDSATRWFFPNSQNPYFYHPDIDTMRLVIELNITQAIFDATLSRFSLFGQKQIIQSFLLEEIESTNKIENIHSTRHDIYSIISRAKNSKDMKIVSIVNAYNSLLNGCFADISNVLDIRNVYDSVLRSCISKEDKPDGELFRKHTVYVTNGIENIHQGFNGEETIVNALKEFISCYNGEGDLYENLALSHFLFETIHPFYDGNGRLGRFLLSSALIEKKKSWSALLISTAFAKNKDKYYKALRSAEDVHQFHCLNYCVEALLSIILDEMKRQLERLNKSACQISLIEPEREFTKNERKIYKFIKEASMLSDFGVSNLEIMEELGVSKRTLMYTLDKFRALDLLEDTQFGRFTYHKAK